MKVVIAAGARFHALHLAQQLAQRNLLTRLYTWSYTKQDRAAVPPRLVSSANMLAWAYAVYHRLHGASLVSRTAFHYWTDTTFDRWLSRKLIDEEGYTVFVGWAHYVTSTMRTARMRGAKVVIELGSAHIRTQQAILREEFARWGIAAPPIDERTIARMCYEYEQADAIMTPSHFARTSCIAQGIAPEKVHAVPYGVNTLFFYPAPVKPDHYTVLFVGALSLCKGVPYLLEAWNRAALPLAKSRLILVGSLRPEMRVVFSRVSFADNVQLYGPASLDTVRALYQTASLFVLPSLQEGLAMVIGQAMASGLPVVCTTHTGGEMFIRHGKEGFLVGPRDVEGLARAIRWGFEQRQQAAAMGRAARKRIMTYTWSAYAEKVIDCYRRF